jgi:hypothetical protein
MAKAGSENSDSDEDAICARERKDSNAKEWTDREASGCSCAWKS